MSRRRSTVTSESVYSEDSGEEHQNRVSASLILAALEHLDVRRSIAHYLPLGSRRNSAADAEHSRLSQMSVDPEGEPGSDVGLAYGGDDAPPAHDMV